MSDFRVGKDGNIMVTTKVSDEIAKLIRTGVSKPMFEIKTEVGLLKRAIQLQKQTFNFNFTFNPVMPLKYIKIDLEIEYE